VPSVNNILFARSTTNSQTLAELQTVLTPRESNSKTGVVSFISTSGASANFLRPDSTNSTTASLLSENGTTVIGVTDDYDGRTRTTTPDIGAYQFDVNYLWTGGNSNWNNANNWNLAKVPVGSKDINISSGTPRLDTNISLQTGKTLLLSGTGSLVIEPTKSLTIAGTADFGGKSVTLQSDTTGSGSIGQITGTLSNASNVTVQRFVSGGKRAFRFSDQTNRKFHETKNRTGHPGLLQTRRTT
jgi:hypothetical protein